MKCSVQVSSVAQSCPTLCNPMNHSMPGLLVHHQLPDLNLCPSSQWCHPAISSSLIPFSSCPQSLPASGSFPVSQLFAWGGQSIGVSVDNFWKVKGVTEDELAGWLPWLNGEEFEQTLRESEGQGSLASCSPWDCRVGRDLVTEQQRWTWLSDWTTTSLYTYYSQLKGDSKVQSTFVD